MVGQQEPVAVLAEPQQGEAQQRGPGEVEAGPAVLLRDAPGPGVLLVRGEGGEIGLAPGHRHLTPDGLQPLARALLHERRPEVGVPLQ